jgi:hypothetical protein
LLFLLLVLLLLRLVLAYTAFSASNPAVKCCMIVGGSKVS